MEGLKTRSCHIGAGMGLGERYATYRMHVVALSLPATDDGRMRCAGFQNYFNQQRGRGFRLHVPDSPDSPESPPR
jgi:hypothetical protein